jgi:hypothetical protein
MPYLNYCNEIWGNYFKTNIEPLVLLQKKAIRIVNNSNYRAHTDPIFKKFNLLKLFDMVHMNTMCMMFKIHNRLLPEHIRKHFILVQNIHHHNTRQKHAFSIIYCRTTLKSMSISIKGPKCWNTLPEYIKSSKAIHIFKNMLKTFLIKKY